jgi:DNA-binding NtrC family response regulator/tetratricopeptide (TPR) repeat protein
LVVVLVVVYYSSMNPGEEFELGLFGESPAFQAVVEKVRRILGHGTGGLGQRRSPPILIQGETGTGKGALARAIWRLGTRAAERFVEVNCAAIPEALLEAELFGFERGAFTGARESKPGLFQEAHRGTLFLDEVGLLPEAQQAKLLTVVEEGAVRRLGRTRSEPVDVWILSASSQDLYSAAREHRFREDLYHRLALVTLSLPPLRERGADVVLLADHFLARDTVAYSLPPRTLSPDARAALLSYSWPGNIRELANVVERVALLTEGPVVTVDMLGLSSETQHSWHPAIRGLSKPSSAAASALSLPPDPAEELPADRVREALKRSKGNISSAANLLGVTRNRLRYRIEKLRLGLENKPARSRTAREEARSLAERRGALEGDAAAGSPPPSIFRWEQRHLALLLVSGGATRDMPADAAQFFETVNRKVESFGGRIVELGRAEGSILAVFGLDALEEAPTRAALAAMALRQAFLQGGPVGDSASDGRGCAIGLALHVAAFDVGRTGQVASIDRDAGLSASDLLRELLRTEPSGAIVVSADSRHLLARKFALAPGAGTGTWHLLHRKESPMSPAAGASDFIGREEPLRLLRDLLEQASSGRGQVVAITGDPGIGKSRLFFEFLRGVREQGVNYIGATCESHTAGIPFFPVIQLVRASCGLTEADSPETTAEKVTRNLDSLGLDGSAAQPYLLKLLGVRQSAEAAEQVAALTSETLNSRTFEVLWQMIWAKNARPQPLVIAVEDCHWIDRASASYFERLVERLPAARLLFLITFRPGYRLPLRAESSETPWTEISLEPLAPEESREVMSRIARKDSIPENLARTILARAEGNPFFLEELALSVGELPSESPALPETIHAAIESRLDRLADAPRRLLGTAAILGREVSLRVLREMWSGEGSVERQLEELTRLEFLTPKRGAEGTWLFKHTLIQEVAYARLLASDRATLHGVAARCFEEFYAGRLEEAYDRLAYHYSKSGERDRAVHYLTRFADKAARSNALAEAVTALEEAFELVERGPGTNPDGPLPDLVLRRARYLTFLARVSEARELLAGERALFEISPSVSMRVRYHLALAETQRFLGDLEPAAENAQRALVEATPLGDEAAIGKVHIELSLQSIWSGDAMGGRQHARKAVEHSGRAGDPRHQGMGYWIEGVHEYLLGSFERALALQEKAAMIASTVDDPRLQSYAAAVTGLVWASRGDWRRGLEHCGRSLSRSPDPINTACCLAFASQAEREKGDLEKSIEDLEQATALMADHQLLPMKGWATAWLAEALFERERHADARRLAEESLEICHRVGPPFAAGIVQRVLGRIALAEGRPADGRAFFELSLRIFESLGSEFEAGRTGMELAGLSRSEGDSSASADHLSRALGRFEAAGAPAYSERAAALTD